MSQKLTSRSFTVIFERYREVSIGQLATPISLSSIRQKCSEIAAQNNCRCTKQSHQQQSQARVPNGFGFRSTRFKRRNDHIVCDASKNDRGADCSTRVNGGAKNRDNEWDRVSLDIARQEPRAATEEPGDTCGHQWLCASRRSVAETEIRSDLARRR